MLVYKQDPLIYIYETERNAVLNKYAYNLD